MDIEGVSDSARRPSHVELEHRVAMHVDHVHLWHLCHNVGNTLEHQTEEKQTSHIYNQPSMLNKAPLSMSFLMHKQVEECHKEGSSGAGSRQTTASN